MCPIKEKVNLLKLADYHDDCLRKAPERVKFPLSKEDRQIIKDMKYSIQPAQLKEAGAPWEAAVGMAANQWGINKQIFVYCPEGDTVNKLFVMINPSYEPLEPDEEDEWEGCFSVPLATGNIRRYKKIRVHYQNEKGEKFTRELSGWYARVWQHENDHLNGFLYDDPRLNRCLIKKQFSTLEEVENFYGELREERRRKFKEEKDPERDID